MKFKFLLLAGLVVLLSFCEQTKSSQKKEMETADFDQQITEKYWKLTELNGQAVTMEENQEREIYFMLKENENMLTGFAGCNHFSGDYELLDNAALKFSHIGGTLKACPDMEFDENDFLSIFEVANQYELGNDQLDLIDGDGNILGRFEAVYF